MTVAILSLHPPEPGDDHKCPLTQATSWGEWEDKEDPDHTLN